MSGASNQCLVWHRADQSALVRTVAELAGLEIVVAGSPERGRGVAEFWPGAVRASDDLRAALASGDTPVALLADPGGFGADPADAAAAEAFVRRGGRIISFEPLPPGVRSAGWGATIDGTPLHALVALASEARATPAIRAALDALEQFGPVTALAVNVTAGADAGSLGARLVSAMELVYLIAGEPEFITAALAGGRSGRADGLAEMAGTLTASIRFADGRTATVLASAVSEPWHRGATVLGAAGRMRIWDDGFAWTGPDGSAADEHRAPEPPGRPAAGHIASAVRAAAAGLARADDGGANGEGGASVPRMHALPVLAMAETALLSVRTGSAESLDTMRRAAQSP